MTAHSDEKQLDELLCLLEQERAFSERAETMSEAENAEHRECVRRIHDLVESVGRRGQGGGER